MVFILLLGHHLHETFGLLAVVDIWVLKSQLVQTFASHMECYLGHSSNAIMRLGINKTENGTERSRYRFIE